MIDALSTCHSCDRPVERPNPGGYCDSCLSGAEISTRTGLRIWSACADESSALDYVSQWAAGGTPFETAFRPDLDPARPWVVFAAADADAITALGS